MGRTLGPSCRQCRREGIKLMLKGLRCHTAKCPMEKPGRNVPPGPHQWRRGKASAYAVRLREKQKVKRYYGTLERQFMIYFHMSERVKGHTGINLLCLLERRLDNVVHKMGLAPSRKSARQLITHGDVGVNDRKVDRPGRLMKPGDAIAIQGGEHAQKLVRTYVDMDPNRPVQAWLEVDRTALRGTVKAYPTREDVQIPVEEHLIVELCGR